MVAAPYLSQDTPSYSTLDGEIDTHTTLINHEENTQLHMLLRLVQEVIDSILVRGHAQTPL